MQKTIWKTHHFNSSGNSGYYRNRIVTSVDLDMQVHIWDSSLVNLKCLSCCTFIGTVPLCFRCINSFFVQVAYSCFFSNVYFWLYLLQLVSRLWLADLSPLQLCTTVCFYIFLLLCIVSHFLRRALQFNNVCLWWWGMHFFGAKMRSLLRLYQPVRWKGLWYVA